MLDIDVDTFVKDIRTRTDQVKNMTPDEALSFLVSAGILNRDGSKAIKIRHPHIYKSK